MKIVVSVILIWLLFLAEGLAETLVEPLTVAPQYRAAAEKRRAEQLKEHDCAKQAAAEKVLPRDRATYIIRCMEAETGK